MQYVGSTTDKFRLVLLLLISVTPYWLNTVDQLTDLYTLAQFYAYLRENSFCIVKYIISICFTFNIFHLRFYAANVFVLHLAVVSSWWTQVTAIELLKVALTFNNFTMALI